MFKNSDNYRFKSDFCLTPSEQQCKPVASDDIRGIRQKRAPYRVLKNDWAITR